MKIGPRLELRQGQQLVMTPQLQQAIRLLQMSRLDAAAFIADEVEKNPLLSIDDGGGDAPAPAAHDRAEEVDNSIAQEDHTAADALFETGGENLYESAEPQRRAREADKRSEAAPERAPAHGASVSGLGAGRNGSSEDYDESLGERTAASVSLRDHLLPQIAVSAAPGPARTLATLLVDELDAAGYLRADLAELAARLGAHAGLVDDAVALLQSCDPAGIGARDLAECLALQLKDQNRLDPAMAALLERLDDLAQARLERLRAACGVDDEDLREMIEEIRRLDPRPGSAFSGDLAPPVTPDVFIHRDRAGGWLVEVNADALPRLLLDRSYSARLSASGAPEARSFVASCRQDADWLLRAIDQRAQTILKVATEITRRQTAFFTEGVAALTPMTLKTVADEIGMHESTISRVTSNKYLACERGLFELKFFFTQAIAAADGGDAISAAAVRHRIKALVEKENYAKPLSDDSIVNLLKQSGVDIARRTVAKYREAMSIPSSTQRKRMKAMALSR